MHPSTAFFAAALIGFAGLAVAAPPTQPTPPATEPAIGAAAPAVAASNAFGLDLFHALAKASPNGNLFISPYSMSIALTMAAEGARDQTEVEMAHVLHFPADAPPGARAVDPVHEGYAALSSRFAALTGNSDPETRKKIENLRSQLNDANARSTKLEREQKWNEASQSAQAARAIADELNALLTKVDRFDLRVANALWVEQTFDLVPAYVKTIDRSYGAGGITPLDFAHNAEPSRQRINAWVEDRTEHRIQDLLSPGLLKPETRLVITNAVYFKGQWASPFSEPSSKEEEFTLANGGKTKAKMMLDPWRPAVPYAAFSGTGEFFTTPSEVPQDEAKRPPTYPDDAGFQLIELPYKGGDLTMVVIAPRTAAGLPALEARLTADALATWLKRLHRRTVDTAIPRFKLASEHEMSPALKSLGMKRAFIAPGEANPAQFTGISDSQDPAKQLYISAVRHKAWIEVAEKGTEAAAATAVVMAAPTSAKPQPVKLIPFTPQFRADRPFLFLIRDSGSGVVLFIGRVTNPSA